MIVDHPILDRAPEARSESLTTMVQREIERMILNAELREGERINENALAGQLGVSRGPIREAVRALEQAGLVRAVVNKGVFVRKVSLKEALDLFDIRAGLARVAGESAALRVSDAKLDELRRLLEEMRAARDLEAYRDLDRAFHLKLFELSGNRKLKRLYDSCDKELRIARRHILVWPEMLKLSLAEHERIIEALAARDSKRAGERFARHLQGGKQRFLEMIGRGAEGVSVAGDDED